MFQVALCAISFQMNLDHELVKKNFNEPLNHIFGIHELILIDIFHEFFAYLACLMVEIFSH